MKAACMALRFDMRDWRMSRVPPCVLVAGLVVIALVLVLPQVDLFDTAFHLDTAPLLFHSPATATPTFQSKFPILWFLLCRVGMAIVHTRHIAEKHSDDALQVLNHTFRC
jgi:hypothetical protein